MVHIERERYLGLLSHFFELMHIPGSLNVAGISTSVLHQGGPKDH